MNKLFYIAALLLLYGCATYYQRNKEFQTLIGKGELDKAEKLLDESKQAKRDRNKLLYFLNMGYIKHLQQDYTTSNLFFNEADLSIEDYKKNYSSEALALITNPEVKPYKAEDFESVMIHYYKAVNYLMLRDFEESLVEARRMNLILNQLDDKYKDSKNRYQADAFAHIIMGLVYEASGKINDAFIAYRNAYEIYSGDHGYFGITVPEQLKKDLIRTAAISGLGSEVERYKKEFHLSSQQTQLKFGEAVVIWQNGMGPIKDEFSINFIAKPGQAGYIIFSNDEYDLTFPFYLGDDAQKKKDLLALRFIRVAFPKYIERPNYYTSAYVMLDNQKHPVERVENINDIAFKTLEDRFLREMAQSLLRLALKKAAEVKLQKENEALGAVATITSAITEKADTRNWQTLPHDIGYARVPLKEGVNQLVLKMENVNGATDNTLFHVDGKKGALYFLPYHSIEHGPATVWDNSSSTQVKLE